MSGIAALLRRDGRPVDADDVVAMLDAIPYRGPDGRQVRAWPEVALGHAKLAVTPEDAAERQPLVSPRSGCAVAADVRLDNRDVLIRQLPGCPSNVGDAELILRAYERWGVAAPERLLGDFAFVIWDPAGRRLVCARDGAGQRPLFFRQDHRAFAAASEIHQLLQDSSAPLAPNEDRIREALTPFNLHRNEKDRPDTYFQGIRSVLAGQVLVVDEQTLRTWQYWRLELPPELRYRTSREYADHFRALLFEAVRARLRTSHPVGVMLSGGLDSSSIACVAQELYAAGRAADAGFTSLSIVYDGLECDERPYIEATRDRYGFAARFLGPDLSIESPAGSLGGFRERPNLATSGFETALREASRLGARTMLTGEIADACVSGMPLVFDSLLKRGQITECWRYLQSYRAISQDPWIKIASLYIVAPLLPLPLHRALAMLYVRREHTRMGRSMVPSWIPEPLRGVLAQHDLELRLAEERGRKASSESRHWDLIGLCPPEAMVLPAGWPVQLLRPYADRRLQEFLLAVPPAEKYEPDPRVADAYAGSKQLIRRGLIDSLPDRVRTRTASTHFGSAALDRLRRQWPALKATFGPDSRSRIAERGFVDADRFWRRLQHIHDNDWGPDLLHVDYCLGLEFWLRSLEQPGRQAVTVQSTWTHLPTDVLVNDNTSRAASGAIP